MQRIRWRMREKCPPGPYTFASDSKAPLHVLVDENGIFETDGLTDYLLYAFAERLPTYRWARRAPIGVTDDTTP